MHPGGQIEICHLSDASKQMIKQARLLAEQEQVVTVTIHHLFVCLVNDTDINELFPSSSSALLETLTEHLKHVYRQEEKPAISLKFSEDFELVYSRAWEIVNKDKTRYPTPVHMLKAICDCHPASSRFATLYLTKLAAVQEMCDEVIDTAPDSSAAWVVGMTDPVIEPWGVMLEQAYEISLELQREEMNVDHLVASLLKYDQTAEILRQIGLSYENRMTLFN